MSSTAEYQPSPNDALLTDLDRRFRAPLVAYFLRRVGSKAEAEDLTQDVFERVLRSMSIAPIGNAEALVFRIAVNLLRDRARRTHRRGTDQSLFADRSARADGDDSVAELADALVVDLSPERVVLGEEALAGVGSALDELSERTCAMFILYRVEGLKIREIADLYGVSPSAVEKQVANALLHLTRRLERK